MNKPIISNWFRADEKDVAKYRELRARRTRRTTLAPRDLGVTVDPDDVTFQCASRIREYWRSRGYEIDLTLVRISGHLVTRSDLIGGFPSYTAKRLGVRGGSQPIAVRKEYPDHEN